MALGDVGLILSFSWKSAAVQLASNPAWALQLEQGVCGMESRLPKEAFFELLPSGMLPDPNTQPGHLPEAPVP